MIFHRLAWRFLRYGDDEVFYRIQAADAARWLQSAGVQMGPGKKAIDLGCGPGLIGVELARRGCEVTLADMKDDRMPECLSFPYLNLNLDTDDLAAIGKYDIAVCSNVFEHLARPDRLLEAVLSMLAPGGVFYLSWTNWYSPWGGHEFAPFHYLGKERGPRIYDRLTGRTRKHTPYVNLFPTSIGRTLARIRKDPRLEILRVVPRYYPELAFIARIPLLRELLTWNCAILMRSTEPQACAGTPESSGSEVDGGTG